MVVVGASEPAADPGPGPRRTRADGGPGDVGEPADADAATLTVVLLPGATTDPTALAATLGSVRGEVGGDVPIVAVRPPVDLGLDAFVAAAELDGIAVVDPQRVADAPGLLAFVRVGDHWRSGTLAARRRPLEAHPTAVLSIAGHRRDGIEAEEPEDRGLVAPPLPPLDPDTLLHRSDVEASAVLVRAEALDATMVELLLRPHGDLACWSRIAARHGHLPSGEIAADVRPDPDRHGGPDAAGRDAAIAALVETGAKAPDHDRARVAFELEQERISSALRLELHARDSVIRRLEAQVLERDAVIARLRREQG